MQTEVNPRRAVDERECAAALNLSVYTLQKDRQAARRIPFFKIGTAVRYDLERVWQALAELEVGGPKARPARRRT